MKFLIVNGPNLNLLGRREPGIYGSESYAALCALIQNYAIEHGSTADCFQSNHEGAIIDALHAAVGVYDAIVINPGAYTHYSYAILDALKAISVPAYEVHISHIDKREPFRAVSVTAPACVGQLYGLGLQGYLRAMDFFLQPEPRLCVIGDPVEHSLSPVIQSAMLQALKKAGSYVRRPVGREELPAFLERVRAGEYTGFNATMPHKGALVPLLDELDDSARLTGSVNAVVRRPDGTLKGYSTDGDGFVESLRALSGDPAGKHIVLLGAGGAARSVAAALSRAGSARLTVCARRPEAAQSLCAPFPETAVPAGFDPDSLSRACAQADVLVNCTSLGMEGQGEFQSLGFLDALPDGSAVCDLVYHPAETALLRRARELGRPAMNGLPLLAWQGVLALEHFLGDIPLNRQALADAAFAALEDR